MIIAGLGDFFDAVGQFFGNLADIRWGALALGLLCFGTYLTLRSRAFFNVLRAAYPAERIEFRRIWGAYIAAYGFNNVVPARGGDVIKLFLVKTLDPELDLLGDRRGVLRGVRLRRLDGHLHPDLRLHPGRLPQAAGLLQARTPSTSASSPRTRASCCSCSPRWRSPASSPSRC